MSLANRILLALLLGAGFGFGTAAWWPAYQETLLAVTVPVGTLWLAALKMVILPLIIALIVTGVGQAGERAKGSGMMPRLIGTFFILLLFSGFVGVTLAPAMLEIWPIDPAAASALKAVVATPVEAMPVPGLGEFLVSLVPSNLFEAAANGAILQLIVFALIFGFAVVQLPAAQRRLILDFFEAIGNALMLVVKGIIWLGPLGVFALAFGLGTQATAALAGALLYYVFLVSMVGATIGVSMYLVARFGGGVAFARFARAALPVQVVAASTQSSLACLPAMLDSSRENLGVPVKVGGVVLPLAVTLFRMTSSGMNIAMAIFTAYLYGIDLSISAVVAVVFVGAIMNFTAGSVPAQINFFVTIPPIFIVLGVPYEILAIYIAIETIPDIFRTIGNVTADLAVSSVMARHGADEADAAESPATGPVAASTQKK